MELLYRRSADCQRIERLPGSAPAQHLFKTEHGAALTELMVDFLQTAK